MSNTTQCIISVFLGLSFVLISCDKDDPALVIDHEIVGTWESTTFEVSDCADESNDVESRTCEFSDLDDVECAVWEFRSNGMVVEDNAPLAEAKSYTIDQDQLTLTDPQTDETVTMRVEITSNTMTWYLEEFNDRGCLLASHFTRMN